MTENMMASGRIIIPNYMPALDINGRPLPGARLYFYQNQTTMLQSVYADSALSVPLTNPVIAGADGVFPTIFADIAVVFSVSMTDADGATIGGLRNQDGVQAAESQNVKADRDGGNVIAPQFRTALGAVSAGEVSDLIAPPLSQMDNRIDTLASSVVAGRRVFATLTERNAWADRPAGALAYVDETGLSYRWDGDSWETFEDPTLSAASEAKGAATVAALAAGDASRAVTTSAQDTPIGLMRRPHVTRYLSSAGRAGVALGLTVGGAYLGASGVITGLRLSLQKTAALDKLVMKAWRRPASTATKDSDPGELGTDVLLWTQNVTATALPLIVGDGEPRAVDLTFANVIDLGAQFATGDILMIAVSAFNASNADTALGFGLDAPSATLPVHERGWYSEVGAGTNWTGLPTNYSPAYTLLGRDVSLQPVIQKIEDRTAATVSALTVADTLLVQRAPVGGYGNISTYGGFAFGFTSADIAAGERYDGVAFDLAVGTGAATVEVALYRRPSAYSATLEPGAVSDVLLERRSYTVAELGLTPGAGVLVSVRHLFAGRWVTPATGFDLATVQAKKADGTLAAMDFNRASQSGWTTDRKGWYRPNLTSGGWSTVSSFANAFALIREGYAIPTPSEDRAPIGFDQIESVTATASGNSAVVSVGVKRLGGIVRISGTLPVTLPEDIPVSGEAAVISRAASPAFGLVPFAAHLDYPGVSDLTVAGLTEGVDYDVNYDLGALRHLTADNVPVSVSYTGSQMAVDAVVLNRSTLALSLIQGPLRGRDALEKRAAPAGPEQVVVAWVVRTQRGIAVAPVHLGAISQRARDVKNRRILARLKARMARGEAINWAGYGDSITQMGGNPDLVATEGTPNGSRDMGLGYLNPTGDGIQSDITDSIPLYTAVQMGMPDDGLGQVHTKLGMNWRAIEAAEAVYGCRVNYFNMGIGGTASSNSIGGVRPNGAYPARLAALNAVCPPGTMDVCVIGFGMNGADSTSTDNDLVVIANAIRAVHPNVTLVFCAPAKPNETFRAGSQWLLQSRQIEWAADHVGAVFIDLATIWGAGGQPGTLGIPPGFECSTTYVNHPGLKELTAMGDLLAEVLLP